MLYPTIAKRIIELKKKDLNFRNQLIEKKQLGNGYHVEMEKIHLQNAEELHKIINEIGYPTIELVGSEASEASWMIIQHAISFPHFMRKCLDLLKIAAQKNKAYLKNMAYLSDRIAVFEEKAQLYGTQFDWDEKGELTPCLLDDWTNVDERRKLIGLPPLKKQIELIREQAKKENQSPPPDFEKRKNELEKWKRKVGWIK